MAKNNGIPIEEFDLNKEEPTSTVHEENNKQKAVEVRLIRVMRFAINVLTIILTRR